MIEFEGVSRVYHMGDEDVHALRDVSLSIDDGEFAVVVGPSGSGKTTLLNMAGGMDLPTSGRVVVDGEDISRLDADRQCDHRYAKVGFVFQDFLLIENLDVYENIRVGLLVGERKVRGDQSLWDGRIKEIIDMVGLGPWVRHKPSQLSGGQRQRISIARALVKRPPLLLADEPTANLDADHGGEIIDLMRSLNKKLGTTCIIATHDERVWEKARRFIRLEDGRLVD